jgi:hypothetical protein
VGMFVCLCLTSKKPSEREFFVPAGTDLGVKLLTTRGFSMGGQGLGDRQDRIISGQRKASEIEKKHAIWASPRAGTSTPGRQQLEARTLQ